MKWKGILAWFKALFGRASEACTSITRDSSYSSRTITLRSSAVTVKFCTKGRDGYIDTLELEIADSSDQRRYVGVIGVDQTNGVTPNQVLRLLDKGAPCVPPQLLQADPYLNHLARPQTARDIAKRINKLQGRVTWESAQQL